VHYPGGALVAAQGKGEAHFFIIVRGKVKVERYGPEAARLAAGDYFGETASARSSGRPTMPRAGPILSAK